MTKQNAKEVEIKSPSGEVLFTLNKNSVKTIMQWMGIKSKKTKVIKRTIRRFIEKELWNFLQTR